VFRYAERSTERRMKRLAALRRLAELAALPAIAG